MKIPGLLDIQRVIEIDRFSLPLIFLFPTASIEDLQPHADCLSPHHIDFETSSVLLAVQSMVIKWGRLNILVDTCVGANKHRPARAEWHQLAERAYLSQLAAAGLRPGDIDIVFCTHLHADHIGWNTRLENGQWVPTFPNARYLISKAELAYWLAREESEAGTANHGSFGDSILPILTAQLVDEVQDGFDLGRGLTVRGLPGHTPGGIGLEIARNGHPSVCLCGDAFHTVAQAFQPTWSSRFCADPAQSRATRMELLTRSREEGLIIIPSHIRGHVGFQMQTQGPHLLEML